MNANPDGTFNPDGIVEMRTDCFGWRLGFCMTAPDADGAPGIRGGFGWDGGTGTTWRSDVNGDVTRILFTQPAMTDPQPPDLFVDFWSHGPRLHVATAALGGARGLAAHPPLR